MNGDSSTPGAGEGSAMYPYATAPSSAERTREGVDTSPTPHEGVDAAEEAADVAETDGGANRVLVALISLGGPNACTRPIFTP
jgi:hypothetical protein